jgi:hydroxymethylpyrimidine pyrophosphatase-like HAD family hydrolase
MVRCKKGTRNKEIEGDMISKKLKMICTDFDGTVSNSQEQPTIPKALLEGLKEAQERGALWVINTGRTLSDLYQELERSGEGIWPRFVVTVEREIYEFRNQEYQSITTWNHKCLSEHQVLFRQAVDFFKQIQSWVKKEFRAETYGDAWSPLCIIASETKHADEIHQRISKECGRFPELTVVRNDVYFRFGHYEYSKGSALGEIIRMLGTRPEEVFAAGDHFNDLTMLDGVYASHVAAPANAIPEVKDLVKTAGGYVSKEHCGLGVIEALGYYQEKLS